MQTNNYSWSLDSDYLEHHGVIGMKWGIRRYQNEDGSYTQEGLRRLEGWQKDYDKKKSTYESVKNDESATYREKAKAHREMKSSERNRNNAYKHLKQDSKADKGKEKAANGQTIFTNNLKAGVFGFAAETGGAILMNSALQEYRMSGYSKSVKYKTLAGLASIGLGVAYEAKKERDDNQLRAYYSHTQYKKAPSK